MDAALKLKLTDDNSVRRVLTPPQSEAFNSGAEYTGIVAGMGSGKTGVLITRGLATKVKYPTIDLGYFAPSYPLIRDIFYPQISEELSKLRWPFHINKAEHAVYIQGAGKIICRTMDNPLMIVGYEIGDALIDEFDVLDTKKATLALQKITARCRQKFPDKKKNQKFVGTTPEGFKATYNLFKKKPLANSKLIHMSTYSNKANLPDDYIDNLLAMYPANLIEAYLMGNFVNLTTGTVYNFDRKWHNTTETIRPNEPLHIGQDFNMNGCVSSVFVIRDGLVYLLDGYVSKDTATVVTNTKQRYPDHFITFYPDSSGKNKSTNAAQTDIQILRKANFRIIVSAANPFIRDRVNCVNNKLDKREFFVNTSKCPDHADALEQQVWDEKTGLPQKQSHPASPDDYNDSIGYFIVRRFPIVRPTFGMAKTV